MLKPEKYKLPRRFAIDFSASQHIVAICIFLIQALVMFCLGVLVGKYQPSSFYTVQERPPVQVSSTQPVRKDSAAAARRWDQLMNKKNGQDNASRPSVAELPAPSKDTTGSAPAAKATPAPAASIPAPTAKPADKSAATENIPAPAEVAPPEAAAKSGPTTTVSEPAPKPTEPAGKTPAAPSVSEPSASPSPKTKQADDGRTNEGVQTGVAKSAVDTEGKSAVSPAPAVQSAVDKSEVKPSPASQEAKPETPAQEGQGTYAIQVASFSGANKRKNAEECVQRLEKNAGMKAELIGTDSDRYFRVLVGNFTDRASAQKECMEMRKRPGFSECFVRQR